MPIEKDPESWAETQSQLGILLERYAEFARNQEDARELARRSLQAHRQALEVWTRSRFPRKWATTQDNVGRVHLGLARDYEDRDALEKAIEAFHDALEERDHGAAPFEWASSELNLGRAYLLQGLRGTETAPIENAIDALEEALKGWDRDQTPRSWATTERLLGESQLVLGERRSDLALYEDAVASFRSGLEVYRTRGARISLPTRCLWSWLGEWVQAEWLLADTFHRRGSALSSAVLLEEAVAAYDVALENDALLSDAAETSIRFEAARAVEALGETKRQPWLYCMALGKDLSSWRYWSSTGNGRATEARRAVERDLARIEQTLPLRIAEVCLATHERMLREFGDSGS